MLQSFPWDLSGVETLPEITYLLDFSSVLLASSLAGFPPELFLSKSLTLTCMF